MKIILTTPLYPPEISETASYVKELAKRLSKKHEITILTYGYIPEKINGVKILTINKNRPLFLRLIAYTFYLIKISDRESIIYTQNGPSVELPIIIVSLLRKINLFFSVSDKLAYHHAEKGEVALFTKKMVSKISISTIHEFPTKKPVINPFESINKEEMEKYEASWNKHLAFLEKTFENERKI